MKRFRIILLGLAILLCKMNFAQVISGTTGVLMWSLDTNDSTLTISGNGSMLDYHYTDNLAPWHAHRDVILTAIIEDSVASIGDCAFYQCNNLTSITISDSITSIGDYAFMYCSNLISITISDNVTSIGNHAFEFCSNLTSVTLSNNITNIGTSLFQKCINLTSIIIPDKVINIGDYAFCECYNLVSVNIPQEVTNIGSKAFKECGKLTSIIIPNKVVNISDYAFQQCSSLTSITIPNSVTSIGGYALGECAKLQSIDVDSDNPAFSSQDGILFNKLKTTVIQYPTGKINTNYTIPNSVTTIAISAFRHCRLTYVTIPNSVTTIRDFAFGYCSNLMYITIGSNVTLIDHGTFHSCSKLKYIYSLNENPPMVHDTNTFMYVNKNTCELHVPIGSKSKYANAEGWKAFFNIQDDVTGINSIKNTLLAAIYPNPTCGQLIIELPAVSYELDKNVDIQIYDIVGKLLQSEIVNLQSEIILDISHLQVGIYFLHIRTNKGFMTKKIIKNM